MHLIQILLPLTRNDGSPQPRHLFAEVRRELRDRYGGLTTYTRAPAEGIWQDDQAHEARDDVVIFEVMVEQLDQPWWAAFRQRMEDAFEQQQIIVRALPTDPL